MAADPVDVHVPTSANVSFTELPEDIDGFIDVETLVDIHKYLSASEKSDDVALAAWVKKHYLHEPLNEIGRPIRDAEGFRNLDRAYRRTRQLTGKAQDKWPFFDKNWKKMSSTVVKNAVHAANGTNLPTVDSEVRDSPMNIAFDGQHDNASQNPLLRTLQIFEIFARNQPKRLRSLPAAEPSLTSQQEPAPRAERQAPEIPDSPGADSVSPAAKFSTLDSAITATTPSADLLQDAGAGKVRGPNGRYVNKGKPSPAAKKGPNIKYVKKSRTRAALEGESDEDMDSSDEGIIAPKADGIIADGLSLESEGIAITAGSDVSQDVLVADASATGDAAPSILAAFSDAIPSNLDRLPPSVMHKKRKSESAIQRGGLKRARGSRGGVLGRPRKSEPVTTEIQPEVEGVAETSQTPARQEIPAKAITRRSGRRSAAEALETATPWDPAGDVLLSGATPKHSASSQDETRINGVDGVVHGQSSAKQSHLEQDDVNGVDRIIKGSVKETVNGKSHTTVASTPASQASKTRGGPTSSKRKKRVSFSPEVESGKVKFFARIFTSAGTQEVPLAREDLTTEVDLVERYAAWQNAGNSDVTFDVFKKIIIFAR